MNKKYITEISSSQNETFKHFKSLTTAKGIKKEGEFLIPSLNICNEFLDTYLQNESHFKTQFKILSVLSAKNSEPNEKIDHELNHDLSKIENLKFYMIDSNLFKEIDILGTHSYLLHVEFKRLPRVNSESELNEIFNTKNFNLNPFSHFLSISTGDPKNLGALIRSALAFQTQAVFLNQEAAHPFLQQSIKSSAGSVFYIPLIQTPHLSQFINFLKPQKLKLYCLDLNGDPITKIEIKKPCVMLLGEEGGYPKDFPFQLTSRVFIPTHGVESLNVSVAGSLALYELNRINS